LELAKNGHPNAFPNPLVGAVIVKNDTIIGEGFHREFGKEHAEVQAIKSVKNKDLLKDASIYVNLEPCSHFGKTPPCSNLIIESGISEVIIASSDPNPLVGGKGIELLTNAGIRVITGILETKTRNLNIRFFTFFEKKRPYIILKYAMTSDGFMADSESRSKWISNHYSRLLVHQWRGEEQAVLVGTKTAVVDNPKLTNRYSPYGQPVRVVLDRENKLPNSFHLFDGKSLTLVFTMKVGTDSKNINYIYINFLKDVISQLLEKLYERKIYSVIVEGGAQTLSSFIENDYWDEARIFIGSGIFSDGIKAPRIPVPPHQEFDIMGDTLLIYKNNANES